MDQGTFADRTVKGFAASRNFSADFAIAVGMRQMSRGLREVT